MDRRRRPCSLLTFMVAAAATISVSLAFNIDTTEPNVYDGDKKDFFGYKVLQYMSGSSRGIIITAPLRLNGSGGICKTDQDEATQCFSPDETSRPNMTVVKHLGLSIAADSTGSQFTVCSPSVAHECYDNSYLNSLCYKITDQLQQISSFTPTFQECKKKTVDLVFLFDGSRSMKNDEFEKNKDFIVDIMNSLKNTSIKFAAVQFSTSYNKVFDFNDYVAGAALDKLKKEPHMKSLTNTHKALTFVLEEIFDNVNAGASPDATKVLVLITDGDPSDVDRDNVVKKYDEKNIIRFVIGVKDAKLDKFRAIASEPKDKNAFKIENYDGLTGVLENFQKQIFNMEGSTVARAGNMMNEMSQTGFSAVFYEDTLILGSVGSNSWKGSLQELQEQRETQIEDPKMQMDSYMGYSVSVGQRNGVPLYFSGAPRFEHSGQIVLFTHNGHNWTASQRIKEDQIGSYFGAELCSVDINSDRDTDFLLVGAPLFYQPQEKKEGRIYIYTLTDEMQLKIELNVTVPSMGRFGTTIASLADLNGDGLRDVAVGAPLEDDNQGAVYIYLGDRHRGIRSMFSQRIAGEKILPGIRFFGQAINGDLDLGDDGLPDIVVGSQGAAVVLRSKPVFNVMAQLSFKPKEISTDKLDCLGTDENLPMVTLTACFEMVEATKGELDAASSGLNISYTLDVDPTRAHHRGFFSQTDKKARNHTSTHTLVDNKTCFDHAIYMPKCVTDTLSPVSIRLNFFQPDSESTGATLNVDSKRHSVIEVPFEKECRKNDTCIAELEVDFNFMTPTLLLKEDSYFNVTVKLTNHGDDSYNTSLTMHYPPGLSFSKMTLTKDATREILHSCHDLDGVLDRTVCGVSLPVYRSRSFATFHSIFRIRNNYKWNDTISMTIAGKSDNTNSTASLTKTIPVQFEIQMALTVKEDSVTYMNFSTDDSAPKKMVISYRMDNIGVNDFPVNATIFFPTKLEHNFEMNNYEVFIKQNKSQCRITPGLKSEECLTDCVAITCDSFTVEKNSDVHFTLSGDVQFRDLKQRAANIGFLKRYTGDGAEVKFKSLILITYDKQRYVLGSHKQKDGREKSHESGSNDPTRRLTEVQVDLIIPPDQLLIILTGAGVGFLLLIIITIIMFKLGCFKRKTLEYYQEQEEAAAEFGTAPTNGTITDGKSELPSEEKKLLGADAANGTSPAADTEVELD